MAATAVEVPDLAAALSIADAATSKWRHKSHHDDMNQAARIAVWRSFMAGQRDPRILFRSARFAAIDELRRLTGRSDRQRDARRSVSIDAQLPAGGTFADRLAGGADPAEWAVANELLEQLAAACRDDVAVDLLRTLVDSDGSAFGAAGVAARHGITDAAVSLRRRRLRRIAAQALAA